MAIPMEAHFTVRPGFFFYVVEVRPMWAFTTVLATRYPFDNFSISRMFEDIDDVLAWLRFDYGAMFLFLIE